MPLYRTALYAKGVQLYVAPTADSRESWVVSMQHIALEGRCFVLACNQFARRSDYPKDYPGEVPADPNAIVTRGGSCIVNPLGQIVAGPVYDAEAILTADVDLGDIVRGTFDFDVVGHYARPDVFRLLVNEEPAPVVKAVAPSFRAEPQSGEVEESQSSGGRALYRDGRDSSLRSE